MLFGIIFLVLTGLEARLRKDVNPLQLVTLHIDATELGDLPDVVEVPIRLLLVEPIDFFSWTDSDKLTHFLKDGRIKGFINSIKITFRQHLHQQSLMRRVDVPNTVAGTCRFLVVGI